MNFRNLRILIADDNVHMRRILRALLLSIGGRNVVEAEDGATALDIFRSQAPDLIITDLDMPILDGLELTRLIRVPDSQMNPFVPIIMISDLTEVHRVIEAREAGVNEFIKKPLSASMLYERIYLSLVEPRPFVRTESYFGPCRHRKTKDRTESDRRGEGGCEVIDVKPTLKIAV